MRSKSILLQKIVNDEASNRNDLFASTIQKTRSKNLAFLEALEKHLVDIKSDIDEISDIADSIQKDNKELIITQSAKAKLQEALVQLLNDTMAEKAAAQITVNETKLATNDCKVRKNSYKNIYLDYETFHADRVAKVKKNIKDTAEEIHETDKDIEKTIDELRNLYEDESHYSTLCNNTRQDIDNGEIHLQDNRRRNNELDRSEKVFIEMVDQKTNVRNAQLKDHISGLQKKFENLTLEYAKKCQLAEAHLKERNETLGHNVTELDESKVLMDKCEAELNETRNELEEVLGHRNSVEESCEEARHALEKKRVAMTRLRNEASALEAELNRTKDGHENEKAKLDSQIKDLEKGVTESGLEKLKLETTLKQTTTEFNAHVNETQKILDGFEVRHTSATKTALEIDEKTKNSLDEIEKIEAEILELERQQTLKRENDEYTRRMSNTNSNLFIHNIAALNKEFAELTVKHDEMKEPYAELIEFHQADTDSYNKLKANVLELNASIRESNEKIKTSNDRIESLQIPREKLKSDLLNVRGQSHTTQSMDSKQLFKLERRNYEMTRKLEEFLTRNGEIKDKILETMISTKNAVDVKSFLHSEIESNTDMDHIEAEKFKVTKKKFDSAIQEFVEHDVEFESELEQIQKKLYSRLKNIKRVSDGIEESYEITKIQ